MNYNTSVLLIIILVLILRNGASKSTRANEIAAKLDVKEDILYPLWQVYSSSVPGYLYYFNKADDINKTILDLVDEDQFDPTRFENATGIWVFPHKYFQSVPEETLIGKFSFRGLTQLFDHLKIRCFLQNGEIKIFWGKSHNENPYILPNSEFNDVNSNDGWIEASMNYNFSSTNSFRVELHAKSKHSFVFLDYIITGRGVVEEKTLPPSNDETTVKLVTSTTTKPNIPTRTTTTKKPVVVSTESTTEDLKDSSQWTSTESATGKFQGKLAFVVCFLFIFLN